MNSNENQSAPLLSENSAFLSEQDLENKALATSEHSTVEGQKSLCGSLNNLLRDCQPVLHCKLFFEDVEDSDEPCAELFSHNDHAHKGKLSESLSIRKVEHPCRKPYMVERAVFVPGVRYTRNGDGWPDDVDVQELGYFSDVLAAFRFLIEGWFREQIERSIESAAETRMMEEQEKAELSPTGGVSNAGGASSPNPPSSPSPESVQTDEEKSLVKKEADVNAGDASNAATKSNS